MGKAHWQSEHHGHWQFKKYAVRTMHTGVRVTAIPLGFSPNRHGKSWHGAHAASYNHYKPNNPVVHTYASYKKCPEPTAFA